MQYTLRKVPEQIDAALRRRARYEGKSINRVALQALTRGLGLEGSPVRNRNLDDIAGTWRQDPKVDREIARQRRIDRDLWQ